MIVLLPVKDEDSVAHAILKPVDSDSILALRFNETAQDVKQGWITVAFEDGTRTLELDFNGDYTDRYQFVYRSLLDWASNNDNFERYRFVQGDAPLRGNDAPVRQSAAAFVRSGSVDEYEYARVDGFDYWILSIDGEAVAALEDSNQHEMAEKVESDLDRLAEGQN